MTTPQKAARTAIAALAAEADIDATDPAIDATESAARVTGRRSRRRQAAVSSTKPMEQMLWDAACSIRGAKDAAKFKDYLLPLLSAVLENGYTGYRHLHPQLINSRDDRQSIGSGLNLERPNGNTRDAHIAQCLDTTRQRLIDAKLVKERAGARKPGKKHGVLTRAKQIEIARAVAPTTIFDYLYRARIKSNYEDPTMYDEGSEDRDALLELVGNTQELAAMLCGFITAALWQTIDEPARKQLGKGVNIDTLLESISRNQ